jgi:hypothetical protein
MSQSIISTIFEPILAKDVGQIERYIIVGMCCEDFR